MHRASMIVGAMAMVVLLASVCTALPPGTTAGTCAVLGPGDGFIEYLVDTDFGIYAGSITELGELESASFGPFGMHIIGDSGADTTILITEYVGGGQIAYATQLSIFDVGGAQCNYITMTNTGRGVCVGGDMIRWIEYAPGPATFSFTATVAIPGRVYEGCNIHRDRAFIYDSAASVFDVFEWSGAAWVVATPATLACVSDAWSASYVRDEIVIQGTAGTLDFYFSSGVSTPPVFLYAIPAPLDFLDLEYDRDDNLVVTTSGAANVHIYQRAAGTFPSTPTQTITDVLTAPGTELCTSSSTAGSSYATVMVPSAVSGGSTGIVRRYRSPSAGDPYVLYDTYESAFSGTGTVCNNAARSPALPQYAFSSDPFFDAGAPSDEANGRVEVMCLEDIDCDGACGGLCELDGDLCTVDVYIPLTGCVFDSLAVPDDGNVCTADTCDSTAGFIYTPLSGGPCSVLIGSTSCPGTCNQGGCEPTSAACGIPSPSPTPSPTPSSGSSASATTTVSSSPTPSASTSVTQTSSNTPSMTASNTASATSSNTASATSSNTPSMTASNTPSATSSNTPSMTASNTPSSSQSQSATTSQTATGTASATTSAAPTGTVPPTASNTPSVSQSATATTTTTPSSSTSPAPTCGPCAQSDTYDCNRLTGCAGFTCLYAPNDAYCEAISSLSSPCVDSVCTASVGNGVSGCSPSVRPAFSVCEVARECIAGPLCDMFAQCIGVPDDAVCSTALNDQCYVNRCSADLLNTSVDAQGCALEVVDGACIPDDPCIVHSLQHPTFCDPSGGGCVGGERIVCDSGEHCELGACVLDQCIGDDDDCYRPDDDDSSSSSRQGDDWLPWMLWAILAAAGCCCCCLFFLFVILVVDSERKSIRRRQEDAEFAIQL